MIKAEIKKVKVNTIKRDGRLIEISSPQVIGVYYEEASDLGVSDMTAFKRAFIERVARKVLSSNKEEEYKVLRKGGGELVKLIVNKII